MFHRATIPILPEEAADTETIISAEAQRLQSLTGDLPITPEDTSAILLYIVLTV